VTAISDAGASLTYRELNRRANAVARHLIANGFRRGSLATVRLPRSPETAVVLLGVLKAGGTYAFIDDERESDSWPRGVSLSETIDGDELRFLAIDMTGSQPHPAQSCANLPILTRDSDVACVLADRDGASLVLVPHETITSLQNRPVFRFVRWAGEPGALDLWMALMSGATVTLGNESLQSAAA
jgi:non-ribosomal peptide synthetase component F